MIETWDEAMETARSDGPCALLLVSGASRSSRPAPPGMTLSIRWKDSSFYRLIIVRELAFYRITSGRKRTIDGKNSIKIIPTSTASAKGKIPLKISSMVMVLPGKVWATP